MNIYFFSYALLERSDIGKTHFHLLDLALELGSLLLICVLFWFNACHNVMLGHFLFLRGSLLVPHGSIV